MKYEHTCIRDKRHKEGVNVVVQHVRAETESCSVIKGMVTIGTLLYKGEMIYDRRRPNRLYSR